MIINERTSILSDGRLVKWPSNLYNKVKGLSSGTISIFMDGVQRPVFGTLGGLQGYIEDLSGVQGVERLGDFEFGQFK